MLVSLLRRLGKTAIPCMEGPWKRPEIERFQGLFCKAPDKEQCEGAFVIIADCSSPDRTGDLAAFLEGHPTAIIDHHLSGAYYCGEGPAGPVFADSKAPATTCLIASLAGALGLSLEREEAQLLLLGLCTDTGFFRHVDEKGAEAFEIAAYLIHAGASPKAAFRDMNGGKSLGSRVLLGKVLSRCEGLFGGRLLFSTEPLEETQRWGAEGRDSDSLYQILQNTAGMEAICIVREEEPGRCAVGMRSRDKVDVAAIAAAFGGGGHKNAAGASVQGALADVREFVLAAFAKVFAE